MIADHVLDLSDESINLTGSFSDVDDNSLDEWHVEAGDEPEQLHPFDKPPEFDDVSEPWDLPWAVVFVVVRGTSVDS